MILYAHAAESHSHHGHHHHEHRGLNEIMMIIDHADMADRARSYAKKIFTILAAAEAKAIMYRQIRYISMR